MHVTAKENVQEPVKSGEGSDTNTGDTPFSVGRSPPQNGNSGIQRTSGTGGLGEGTPKVCFYFFITYNK